MSLFMGHSGAHGTHGEPYQEPGKLKWEIKKTARTVREPVTLALWETHLKGDRPLGVITIRDDSTCSWGSIDVDKYDEDFVAVHRKIRTSKLPLVPCQSKSGGLHLFLFMANPQKANEVQSLLRDIAGSLGLAGSEIFPKQTHVLSERGDLGSWMIMPYFGTEDSNGAGTFGGRLKEQVGVKPSGGHMTVTEFLREAEKLRLDDAAFAALSTTRGKQRREEGAFSDGPPCMQNLAKSGFPEGGRNNSLFHMGIYFKKSTTDWKEEIQQANRKYMNPPLTHDEVQGVIKSLDKKEYEYLCKIEPMCSHCDSLLCRTRKFGVGDGLDIPVLTGVSRLDAQPPLWFIDVQAIDTRLALTTEELQQYLLFQRACMMLGKYFPPMKPSAWAAILGPAIATSTLIESSPEVSVQGQFLEHLEEFLTNKLRAQFKDQIAMGKPWEDEEEGKFYFRLKDLEEHIAKVELRDENRRQVTRGRITKWLTDLGGGPHSFFIKKKFIRCWFIPSSAIQQQVSIDPPPIERSKI